MDDNKTSPKKALPQEGPSYLWVGLKFLLAVALFTAGLRQWTAEEEGLETTHRRLTEASSSYPSYMEPLMQELKERKKLFEESEVVKYWFEYTGPLQVSTRS